MKETCQGSYTVEAALIMPLVIVLLVMTVDLSFFLHDENGMFQSAYLIALRKEREEETVIEEFVKDRSLRLLWNRYEEQDSLDKIAVAIQGGVNSRWSFREEAQVYKLKPVRLLRIGREEHKK